jgi:hypothetical protein
MFGRVQAAPTDPVQNNSVGLQGTVRADPPKTGATITFPGNGQVFTDLPIKVSGLCSTGLLVKLFKNGVFGGSTQCTNGTYSISTDLFTGANELVARVYDDLDQAGPDSNIVTVTFTPTGFNGSGPRITLTSNYAKRGANPNETLVWPLILSGGVGPYAISIDWGDGKTELMSRSLAGQFDISHKYVAAGIYSVIVKVTDSTGTSAFLQLVAVANGPLSQDNQANANSTTPTRTVVIWWPVVAAAVMVILSFWLGARHKLEDLRKQAEKRINY